MTVVPSKLTTLAAVAFGMVTVRTISIALTTRVVAARDVGEVDVDGAVAGDVEGLHDAAVVAAGVGREVVVRELRDAVDRDVEDCDRDVAACLGWPCRAAPGPAGPPGPGTTTASRGRWSRSLRSVLNTVIGVVAGTLTVAETLPLPAVAAVEPVLCSALGAAVVSTAQSGPPSVADDGRATGVDAVEHARVRVGRRHIDVARQRAGALRRGVGALVVGEERNARALVAAVADPVGVARDPESGVGLVDLVGRLAARVAARVPLQRDAVLRVERHQTRSRDRPLAGRVRAVGVVHPAVVAADVDGRLGDLDAPQRVAAGVVGPRRRERRPDGVGLEARRDVAQRAADADRRWWRPRSTTRRGTSRRRACSCRTRWGSRSACTAWCTRSSTRRRSRRSGRSSRSGRAPGRRRCGSCRSRRGGRRRGDTGLARADRRLGAGAGVVVVTRP